VDEPEKCTSTKTAADEGQKRGNEDGGPNWDAATEVSAGAHRVIQKLVSLLGAREGFVRNLVWDKRSPIPG
jgi:hypothetical protein